MKFRKSHIFWHPLAKASTLGLLGRRRKGEEYVEKLLAIRPDFASKGSLLISRYVKFPEIAERLMEGLREVGLRLEA